MTSQFVLSTSQKIEKLSFEVTDLKREGSQQIIGKELIFKGFVRYVMTDELNKNGRGGCGYRPHLEFFDSTLVADPIDHLTRELQLEANTTQDCWVRVQVPQQARPGEALYHEIWHAMLTSFANHLKEKGWFERTCISMDERPIDQMKTVIKLVKSLDPQLKITLAGILHEDMMKDLHYYSVPLDQKFYGDDVHLHREAGQVTTFYTCYTEPYPNTFTFCEPADAEWLRWYTAKEHLDGYLRWALNSWVIEPLLDSRFHTWAASDTYMIYPGGRTSVRFERLVDGIQSCEKVRILREELEREPYWKSEQILKRSWPNLMNLHCRDVPLPRWSRRHTRSSNRWHSLT